MASKLNVIEQWYLDNRGIKAATLKDNGVETFPEEAVPYARWKLGDTHKRRTGFLPGQPRTFRMEDKGFPVAAWRLRVKAREIADPVIVCEGETDALRLWQEGGKELYGSILALPGCDAITPEVAAFLAQRSARTQLYFVLDNDKPDEAAYDPDDWKDKKHPVAKVDDAWTRIKSLLPKARRIYLPPDYKDVCEYLNVYGLKDFDQFVVHAEARYNFPKLDLSQPPKATDWLWYNIIPTGRVGLLQGDQNVGKSLLYQALAVALANGETHFLGQKLNPTRGGKVLIVDNENAEADTRLRLEKLGLKVMAQKKLHIVSGQDVRIDRPADNAKLFEDVSNFEPDLVVLDSFVRLHSQDENSSGAVSQIYNDGLLPLSRKLGAAVLLLHHVNKSNSGDSKQKTRGSGDIGAAPDFCYELADMVDEVSYKFLSRFKNRLGAVKFDLQYRIEDRDDGGLDFPLMSGTEAL